MKRWKQNYRKLPKPTAKWSACKLNCLDLSGAASVLSTCLPDISVAATILGAKCESLEKITDEIIDARPDD